MPPFFLFRSASPNRRGETGKREAGVGPFSQGGSRSSFALGCCLLAPVGRRMEGSDLHLSMKTLFLCISRSGTIVGGGRAHSGAAALGRTRRIYGRRVRGGTNRPGRALC